MLTNDSVHVIDDSDEENNTNAPPSKREKKSAFKERKQTVQKIANNLHDKQGSMLNMVQYRLWAESLHSMQHNSWDEPPKGLP